MQLSMLQYKSSGEIEATIYGELSRFYLPQFHPNFGGSRPLPRLKQARDEMYYSFGYLTSFESNARAWIIRMDVAYHIYVGKELPADFQAALTAASCGDLTCEVVAPGWTKLHLQHYDSLVLAVGALRRWMNSGAPGVAPEQVESWRG